MELFQGNMDNVFQNDPVLFQFMRPFEKRVEFYIKIFEAYKQMHKFKIKHCDIRPENILYKQISETEFIPVFANFNQIISYKKYCPDGELAYMSPDEYKLDIMFPSDTQKKKAELFSLALTILQIEANFFQAIQNESIENVMKKDEEFDRKSVYCS
jgi:serine/threonine protein kinase